MRRILASLAIAAATAAPIGLAIESASSAASAATTTTACTTTYTRTTPPSSPTVYKAGPAGSVTVAPGKYQGNVRVVSVAPATGWKYFVDTASGNSVDVYFSNGLHHVKFEAGVESATLMIVMVRVC